MNGLLYVNKPYLRKQEIKRQNRVLYSRVKKVKKTVDNNIPNGYSNYRNSKKKMMVKAERKKINKDNGLLLKRLRSIAHRPLKSSYISKNEVHKYLSISNAKARTNDYYRQVKLEKIQNENLMMLERIQRQKASVRIRTCSQKSRKKRRAGEARGSFDGTMYNSGEDKRTKTGNPRSRSRAKSRSFYGGRVTDGFQIQGRKGGLFEHRRNSFNNNGSKAMENVIYQCSAKVKGRFFQINFKKNHKRKMVKIEFDNPYNSSDNIEIFFNEFEWRVLLEKFQYDYEKIALDALKNRLDPLDDSIVDEMLTKNKNVAHNKRSKKKKIMTITEGNKISYHPGGRLTSYERKTSKDLDKEDSVEKEYKQNKKKLKTFMSDLENKSQSPPIQIKEVNSVQKNIPGEKMGILEQVELTQTRRLKENEFDLSKSRNQNESDSDDF